MTQKPKPPDNAIPSHQQVSALLQRLAAAERTFQALGANVDPEKHIVLLRQAQDFLRQIEAAQQTAEKSRQESESRFRSVWENSADGMRLTDENGAIVAVNQAFCKMVGMKRDELEGKPMTATYSDKEDLEKIMQKYRLRFRERSVKRFDETKLIFRSGRAAILQVSNSFVAPENERPLLLSVFRDLTDKRRLEAQLSQTQKMDSIGRLAGGLATDYKEILTVIQTNASLLSSGKITALQLADAARQISSATDRAAQLNRQLQIFSQRQTIQPRTIDLNEFLQGASAMLRRLLPENIALQIEPSQNLPLVDADPELLEQILTNMAFNSRDAMPKGGQFVLSTTTRLIDGAYVHHNLEATAGNHVCLKISDTGCGISQENLPYIFEPFFSTKEAKSGLGLSLAIVYGIIKQHKGWVTVSSEIERGTTFEIFLPVSDKKVKSAEVRPAEKKPKAPHETILVVEDEPLLLELTKHFLESHGYKVIQAASGVDALQIWEGNKEKIDLLFTDIVMPGGINGRQLAEKLLAEKQNLKVVYTSGYSAGILGKNFVLQEGINFLQKPYHRRQLVKMIRDALDAK